MRCAVVGSLCVAMLAVGGVLAEETDSDEEKKRGNRREINHYETKGDRSVEIAVSANEYFVIEVTDTCTGRFDYKYAGAPPLEPVGEPEARQEALDEECEESTVELTLEQFLVGEKKACLIRKGQASKTITIPHDPANGGYLIEIVRKPTAKTQGTLFVPETVEAVRLDPRHEYLGRETKKTCKEWTELYGKDPLKPEKLGDMRLLVSVLRPGWNVELAGAFTMSGLVDEEYGVVTRDVDTDGDGTDESVQLLVREKDREDDVRPGLAAFIHLSHPRVSHFSLSFGVGIDSGDLNYYAGPSWRLSGKGFLTGGVNVGPVSALPSSVRVSKDPAAADFDPDSDLDNIHPIADVGTTSNFGTRTDRSFFVAFSYSFLSSGEATIKKRFATPSGSTAENGKGDGDSK